MVVYILALIFCLDSSSWRVREKATNELLNLSCFSGPFARMYEDGSPSDKAVRCERVTNKWMDETMHEWPAECFPEFKYLPSLDKYNVSIPRSWYERQINKGSREATRHMIRRLLGTGEQANIDKDRYEYWYSAYFSPRGIVRYMQGKKECKFQED